MKTETAEIVEVSPEPMGVAAVAQQRLVRLGVWLRNLRAWKTARANRDLQRAMQKDPDFAHVWQCNIAMPILDGANGKLTPEEANEIADRLMAHLFNVKTNDRGQARSEAELS